MPTGDSVNQDRSSSTTSLSLLERAKGRDEAAWEHLVSLYGPLVDRWCRQAHLRGDDVRDVSQDVFVAVWRKIPDFHRERPGDSFRGWLRAITRSKVCDHRRKTRPGQVGQGGSDAYHHLLQMPAPGPEEYDEAADAKEERILYRRALELIRRDFGEKTWQAFRLVVIEGRPPADVAACLNKSINAVYLAKARVIARLREEFGGLLDV